MRYIASDDQNIYGFSVWDTTTKEMVEFAADYNDALARAKKLNENVINEDVK